MELTELIQGWRDKQKANVNSKIANQGVDFTMAEFLLAYERLSNVEKIDVLADAICLACASGTKEEY